MNQKSQTPPRKRSSTEDGNDINRTKEISESCASDVVSSAPADEATVNVSSTNESFVDAATDDHLLSSVLPDVPNAVSEYTVNEDLSVTINMHSGFFACFLFVHCSITLSIPLHQLLQIRIIFRSYTTKLLWKVCLDFYVDMLCETL